MRHRPPADSQETIISPRDEIGHFVDGLIWTVKWRHHSCLVERRQTQIPEPEKSMLASVPRTENKTRKRRMAKLVSSYFSRAGGQVTANLVDDRGILP